MPDVDYETQYLALCQRHEGLRGGCPCNKQYAGHWERCVPCLKVRGESLSKLHSDRCFEWQGRGWLPKPEPERLGALVEVAGERKLLVELSQWGDGPAPWNAVVSTRLPVKLSDTWGGNPWQALTAALTEALPELRSREAA